MADIDVAVINRNKGIVAAASVPAAVVPTSEGSVTISWGDWIAQAAAKLTPLIESGVEVGVATTLAVMPFGNIVSTILGPTIVKEYVDKGLALLEAALTGKSSTVVTTNDLENFVLNNIVTSEPALAGLLGGDLLPMIQAEIASLTGTTTPPATPAAT